MLEHRKNRRQMMVVRLQAPKNPLLKTPQQRALLPKSQVPTARRPAMQERIKRLPRRQRPKRLHRMIVQLRRAPVNLRVSRRRPRTALLPTLTAMMPRVRIRPLGMKGVLPLKKQVRTSRRVPRRRALNPVKRVPQRKGRMQVLKVPRNQALQTILRQVQVARVPPQRHPQRLQPANRVQNQPVLLKLPDPIPRPRTRLRETHPNPPQRIAVLETPLNLVPIRRQALMRDPLRQTRGPPATAGRPTQVQWDLSRPMILHQVNQQRHNPPVILEANRVRIRRVRLRQTLEPPLRQANLLARQVRHPPLSRPRKTVRQPLITQHQAIQPRRRRPKLRQPHQRQRLIRPQTQTLFSRSSRSRSLSRCRTTRRRQTPILFKLSMPR